MKSNEERLAKAARSNYSTGDNLRKRQALSHFVVDFVGTPPDVFLQSLPTEGLVLDVGCGNGQWAERVLAERRPVIGLDSSAGLTREFQARSLGPAVEADARALPFASDSVDAVLMLWMLYHVEDKNLAISEAIRVLRPGGLLVASTNAPERGQRHMELMSEALGLTVGRKLASFLPDLDFHTLNGKATLASHFETVEAHSWEAIYELAEPRPLVDYLDSLREPVEAEIGEAIAWDEALAHLERIARNEIAASGPLRFARGGSLFIASKPGKASLGRP